MTDDELLALCEKASPAPWQTCHDGVCPCKSVWTPDHPVARVEAGEWGDEYAALRLKEVEGCLRGTTTVVEAYMERIPYGAITEETARANAVLIAAAREAIPRLIAEKREAEKALMAALCRCRPRYQDDVQLELVPGTHDFSCRYRLAMQSVLRVASVAPSGGNKAPVIRPCDCQGKGTVDSLGHCTFCGRHVAGPPREGNDAVP